MSGLGNLVNQHSTVAVQTEQCSVAFSVFVSHRSDAPPAPPLHLPSLRYQVFPTCEMSAVFFQSVVIGLTQELKSVTRSMRTPLLEQKSARCLPLPRCSCSFCR